MCRNRWRWLFSIALYPDSIAPRFRISDAGIQIIASFLTSLHWRGDRKRDTRRGDRAPSLTSSGMPGAEKYLVGNSPTHTGYRKRRVPHAATDSRSVAGSCLLVL